MSDERRRRQQGYTGAGPQSRKSMVWAGLALLLAVAYTAVWYHDNHRYDGFAKCLAAKQVKMYGLSWCPHCADQKAKFGKSFQYVPYVECAIADSHEITQECKTAGTKLFPSWQFGNNPPKEGELSLQELGDKAGCSLP
jgi:hypothetical protein